MNKHVSMIMRILLYITIFFAVYMLFSHLLSNHNIKIWLVLIPIIILELLTSWIKDKYKSKKSGEDNNKRYNDNVEH